MPELGHWQTKSSEVVYETGFIKIHSDEVTMPNGQPGHYGWVEGKNEAAYVVPITDDNEVILVQQQRYTIGSTVTLECVAGGRKAGETHIEAGYRELREETGFEASSLVPVLDNDPLIYPSISKTYDPYKLYIARGLRKVSDELDSIDGIERVVFVPVAEVSDKVLSGEIVCSQSIACILAAKAYLERESSRE